MLIVLKGQGAGCLGVLCGLLMNISVLDPPGLLYKSNSIILGSLPSWWTIPQRSCLIWKPRVQHRLQGGHHPDHSRSKLQNQICSLIIHAILHSLVHSYPFLLWKKKGSKISCCSCLMAKNQPVFHIWVILWEVAQELSSMELATGCTQEVCAYLSLPSEGPVERMKLSSKSLSVIPA